MRKLCLISIVLALAALFAGCDSQKLINALVSPDDVNTAKTYIGLLRAQKVDQLEQAVDPSVKARHPNLHALLLNMAARMPASDPLSEKLVNFNTFTSSTQHKSSLTFEYQYPDEWLLVSITVLKQNGTSSIIDMNVRKLGDSLENLHQFKLVGKPAWQYAVLVAAVAAPLLSIYALIVCARSRLRGQRWLWMLFILVGFMSLSVNWATGAWSFQPVHVQLLSAGAFAPPYGTWTISVSLPLGAIWFLLRRKALVAPVEAGSGT
jgi:hypothetical protein